MYPIGIGFPGSWIDFLAAGRLFHNKFLFEVRCQATFFSLNSPNTTLSLPVEPLDPCIYFYFMQIFTFISCKFPLFFIGNEAVYNCWPILKKDRPFNSCRIFLNIAVLVKVACRYTLRVQVIELHSNSKLGYLKYKWLKISRYVCDSKKSLCRIFTKKCGFNIHKQKYKQQKKGETPWTDPTDGGCDGLYFAFWEIRKNSLFCERSTNTILQQRLAQGSGCSLPVLLLAQRISQIGNQRYLKPLFVPCLPVTVHGWPMDMCAHRHPRPEWRSQLLPLFHELQLKRFRSYTSGLAPGE